MPATQPLPSSGSISIGQISNHCYAPNFTPPNPEALRANIKNQWWFDTLIVTTTLQSYTQNSVSLLSQVTTFNYRNVVDTDVTVTARYEWFNGNGAYIYTTYITVLNGDNSASSTVGTTCFSYGSCYANTAYSWTVYPYSSGDSGPADNLGWYRGKLRFNYYYPFPP